MRRAPIDSPHQDRRGSRVWRRRFCFREEPEADGYLRAVEDLAMEGDHVVLRCAQDLQCASGLQECAGAQGSVHEVGLDEGAADVALPWQALRFGLRRFHCAPRRAVAELVGGHAAIRQDEASHTDGGGGGVRGTVRFGAGHEGGGLPRQRRFVDVHAASLIWRFRAAHAGFGTTDFTDDTDGRVTVMWWR